MIDEKFIVATLKDLVRIDSRNPGLVKDGPGEEEIGRYIDRVLKSFGIQSTVVQLSQRHVNVIGALSGKGNGKSLMLNAHMDTVGVEGMKDPFSAAIKDGKLYGRGAYDMKASIAAILGVVKAISDNFIELNGDIILAFVADEEYESIGTQELVKHYRTDAAIVAEPTNLNVCIAHRGFGIFEITTYGKIAHGGEHHKGIDANINMGRVLSELDKLAKALPQKKIHPLCGHASMHVPLIQGGKSLFIYSGECTIKVERRTLPGETEQEVFDELKKIIDELTVQDKDFNAAIKRVIWREPYEISPDTQIVKTVKNSVTKVIGSVPSYIGHTWWEDSAILGNRGIDTIIIGPRGGGIHQETEWVEIQSVIDFSNILFQISIDHCS